MTGTSPFTILGIVGFGMGLSFAVADWRSPTSRALALLFGLIGVNMLMNAVVPEGPEVTAAEIALWGRLFPFVEACSFFTAYEWLLRIRRTETASEGSGSRELLLRAAQVIAVFHGVVGLLVPQERYALHVLMEHGLSAATLSRLAFWYSAVPIYASMGLAGVSIVQLVRSRPDSAEVIRLTATAIATPFLISGMFLRREWQPVLTAIGAMIFLAGSMRYHVLQGQRAQFLGRFLSPQVARLVRERGLERVLQRTRLEISALVCDLRGFTRFSEAVSSDAVTTLLEEFYDAVGAAVAGAGGTIKDHAGDGVLALFGAPLPLADHAARATEAAIAIRERTAPLLRRWSGSGPELGLGIGIASGSATVGVIGGATRLEYVAVGPAVNLASRLCDRAGPGEILADAETAGLASARGQSRFEPRGSAPLPGLSEPVVLFALDSSRAARAT